MRSSVRAFGVVGALAILWAGEVQAQARPIPPAPGRREIPNLDISPNGGWRAKVRKVQTARRAALARGDLRALNAPGFAMAVQGELSMPVVFLAYGDTTVTPGVTPVIGDTGLYRSVFFGTDTAASYSLKTYYEQLSNGALTIDGSLFGWINTGKTYAGVGQNCAAVFCSSIVVVRANFGQFLKAALDSLNGVNGAPQVNWGQFDNDGPDGNPNSGDDDGVVDFVTFVHPSVGGECGGPSGGQLGNRIWAHRWVLTAALGSVYTTNTPRTGGGFIQINDYTIQSARGGASSCSASGIMPIGTLAHETGHTFNIPDLYATSGASEGVGEWSLMGSGNYVRPGSPAAWDAWSLTQVGWVTVDTLKVAGTYTLGPIQTRDTVLYVPIPSSDQYLLIENRQALHSDTAQMDPSVTTHQKSPGLLIWQIDQSIVDLNTGSNTVNAGATEGVRLLQADGLNDLHLGNNRGDLGDSYPGSTGNRTLGPNTNPAARTNEGVVTGFTIDSIFQVSANGPMIFRFTKGPVAVAVTYQQATDAILGLAALSGPQAVYLDDVGNNNDVYDLGDYLAFLKANGFVLAPGILQRIPAGRVLAPTKER